jgi:hypothetical protein
MFNRFFKPFVSVFFLSFLFNMSSWGCREREQKPAYEIQVRNMRMRVPVDFYAKWHGKIQRGLLSDKVAEKTTVFDISETGTSREDWEAFWPALNFERVKNALINKSDEIRALCEKPEGIDQLKIEIAIAFAQLDRPKHLTIPGVKIHGPPHMIALFGAGLPWLLANLSPSAMRGVAEASGSGSGAAAAGVPDSGADSEAAAASARPPASGLSEEHK